MSSSSNSVPASTLIVGMLCLSIVAGTVVYITNQGRPVIQAAEQDHWIPFRATGYKRGSQTVLHVTGTEEQVRSVAEANPDARIIAVQPTDKSLREIHTDRANTINRELNDVSDMLRTVRQR